MEKKKVLFVLLALTLLASCTSKKPTSSLISNNIVSSSISSGEGSSVSSNSSSEKESSSSIKENSSSSESSLDNNGIYVPTITGYTNLLNKPSLTVHKLSDITSLMDYYAYYYVDSFEFELADDYTYYTGYAKDFDKEMNAAYWAEELVNGVMGILHTKEGNKVKIDYVHYDRNTIKVSPTTYNGNDISYKEGNYNSNLTFATDDSSKQVVDVKDSQQLFYAAQHGYKVNVESGSSGERIYTLAKSILNNIISPQMGTLDKVYAIYDYLEHNCVYDYGALEDADTHETKDMKMLPDEWASPYQCYYIEGCLENKMCVCDGYAKTMSLLCNMVGIDCIRDSGSSDKNWVTREVAGHAYNYVKNGDLWYLCCPTWGQPNLNSTTYTKSEYLMTTMDYSSSFFRYASINSPSYVSLATYKNNANDVLSMRKERFENKSFTSGGKEYSCFISSQSQIDAIYKEVSAKAKNYISVYATDQSICNLIEALSQKGLRINDTCYYYDGAYQYEYLIYRDR